MTDANNESDEPRQLWSAYEAVLWAGLFAVKNQATVSAQELDRLIAAYAKTVQVLDRLRELIDR